MEKKYARYLLDEIMQKAVAQDAANEMREVVMCRTAAAECDVLLNDGIKNRWPPNLSRKILKKIQQLKGSLGKLELLYTLEKKGKFDPEAKDFLAEIIKIAKKMRRDRLYQRELWLLQEQDRLKKLAEDFKEWKKDLNAQLKESIEQLEVFFTEYKEAADVWQAKLSYLQKQLEDLQCQIREIDVAIEKLDLQIQDKTVQIEQNNEQIYKNEANINIIDREINVVLDKLADVFIKKIAEIFAKNAVQFIPTFNQEIKESVKEFFSNNNEAVVADSNWHSNCAQFCMAKVMQKLPNEQKMKLDLKELQEQLQQDMQQIKELVGDLQRLSQKKKELVAMVDEKKEKNQLLESEIEKLVEKIGKKKEEKVVLMKEKDKIELQIKEVKIKISIPENELSEKEEVNCKPKITFG